MKIVIKNNTELLNKLYGDNEDYDYINKRGLKTIIKEHIDSLDRIYKFLEEHDFLNEDLYNLGDCTNLIELFKNAKIESESEE